MFRREYSIVIGFFLVVLLERSHSAAIDVRHFATLDRDWHISLIREKRGAVIDTVKGWFGFGQNGNNNPSSSGSGNNGNPQPSDSAQSGGAVDTGTQTDNGQGAVSAPSGSGGSSGGNGGNGVRTGPSPGNSGGGSQQSFTGNKWIDTAINAATGSGSDTSSSDNAGGQSGIGSRIVDALVKEGIKTLLGGVLGG